MAERERDERPHDRSERSLEREPSRGPQRARGGPPARHELLQRTLGNRIVGATLRVQAKLQIGPVDDPFEREADRVADTVLRDPHPSARAPTIASLSRVQRAAEHGPGCGCGDCVVQRHPGHDHSHDAHGPSCTCPQCAHVQRKADAHAPGCPCHDCAAVQRKPAADGSFSADPGLTARIQRLAGGGAPLPDAVRGDMEQRFDADFSGVRVHADGEAAALSRDLRAHAFTLGQHIAFAPGKYDPSSASGRWLLAHELTHTIQQTGVRALRRKAEAPEIHARHDPHLVVQRHSTHEHYLLGTLKPEEIARLPFLRAEVVKPKQKKGLKAQLLNDDLQDESFDSDLDKALHILTQEMDRLIKWQKEPPKDQLAAQDERFGAKIGQVTKAEDNEYQVPYVRIPTKENTSVICTYGELNTLADMFGTIEDMKGADPESIVGMLQAVRQRSYLALHKIYTELGGKHYESKVKLLRPDTSFEGIIGFSGKEKGPLGGLSAVQQYEADTLNEQNLFDEENATAALARNACHFAPETWDTWRRYHEKARALAKTSFQHGQNVTGDILGLHDPEDERKKQRELANAALLHAGFGDHYLQDAYAAGHLIDKTRVMQWYFQWQAQEGKLKETPGYAMIAALVAQPLKSNPQMMENVRGGVSAKLGQIGVTVDKPILALMWWRKHALAGRKQGKDKYNRITVLELVQQQQAVKFDDGEQAAAALRRLVELGFAVHKNPLIGKEYYELRDEHINVIDPDLAPKDPMAPSSSYQNLDEHHDPKRDSDTTYFATEVDDYQAAAREFYYTAYAKFLNKAHLQLITNYLHNIFCAQGLEVRTAGNEDIGRIYGDVAMLTAGGQDGVRHSATTGQMAREAIYDILNTGQAKTTTGEIEARFPRKVAADWSGKGGTEPIDINDWWEELEAECVKKKGLFAAGSKGIKALGAKWVKKTLSPNEKLVTPYDQLVDDEPEADQVQEDVFFGSIVIPKAHDSVF